MARQTKEPMYEKLHKRTERDTREERDLGYGRVLDYGRGHDVEIFWNGGGELEANQMVKLRISGRGLEKPIDLILDNEQLMKFCRWV